MTDFPAHADRLDCLQANLALLADRHHGTGTHLRLGAELRLAPRPVPDGPAAGLLTVEPTLDAQLADAERLLGLALADRQRHTPGSESGMGAGAGAVARAVADGPVYVVADAYHLPWVPYYGTKHVEHSFLVERDAEQGADGVVISDAYHNDTAWGRARPVQVPYAAGDFAALLDALPDGAEILRFTPQPLGPPPEPAYTPGPAADYLRGYAEHADRKAALEAFTLETWLLARSRHLHAEYALQPAGDAVGRHLSRWDGLVEHTYLAFRRVERGRAEPPGLFERAAGVLNADAAVFAVPALVRETVASVLGVGEEALEKGELTSLPEFNSLRMVEVVELLEDRFAVEFDAADLVPENLQRLDDLCALVHRALDRE